MINWKTIIGALIVFGASSELFTIIIEYRSGEMEFWAFGADVMALRIVVFQQLRFRLILPLGPMMGTK